MEMLGNVLTTFLLYFVSGLSLYFVKRCGYYIDDALKNDKMFKKILIILLSCGVFLQLIINIIVIFFMQSVADYIISGLGFMVGLILSKYLIEIMNKRLDVRAYILEQKLDELKNQLRKLEMSSYKNKEQKEAINVLKKTVTSLTEQLNDIIIKESIKIGKEIEINYNEISIRKELDELEALQELAKYENE